MDLDNSDFDRIGLALHIALLVTVLLTSVLAGVAIYYDNRPPVIVPYPALCDMGSHFEPCKNTPNGIDL